ncbi:MAG: hypothetical protein JNM27_08220 [Leptospirales bacterium]|nr:hypothetical protein [Leptospirales bacterium]
MDKSEKTEVLIVDGDEGSREVARSALELNGFSVRTAAKRAEALRLITEKEPAIVLTETSLADARPADYLDALEMWTPNSVILFYTQETNIHLPDKIFDIIRKSNNSQQMVSAVMRASEFQKELTQTNELERLHHAEFANRLNWLLWKRRTDARGMIDYGRRVVSNLRHAMMQGAGVGGMLTQIEIAMMAKPNAQGERILKPEIADLLKDSIGSVRAWMNSLQRFAGMKSVRYTSEQLTANDVRLVIEESVSAVEKFRTVGGQQLVIDPIRFEGSIESNREALGLTLREILTNAFKYSPPRSTVNITELKGGRSISIAVLNDALVEKDPMDLSGDAFLPFARTGNLYQDAFVEEELSLGIGLPVVQEAMQQTGGAVFLRRIQSHTESAPKSRVLAEILLGVRENRP